MKKRKEYTLQNNTEIILNHHRIPVETNSGCSFVCLTMNDDAMTEHDKLPINAAAKNSDLYICIIVH